MIVWCKRTNITSLFWAQWHTLTSILLPYFWIMVVCSHIRTEAAVMKSIWPLLSSSFSNDWGDITSWPEWNEVTWNSYTSYMTQPLQLPYPVRVHQQRLFCWGRQCRLPGGQRSLPLRLASLHSRQWWFSVSKYQQIYRLTHLLNFLYQRIWLKRKVFCRDKKTFRCSIKFWYLP